jgi:hypothetical protein
MGSLIKLVAGMAIGAAIAVVATRMAEKHEQEAPGLYSGDEDQPSGFMARLHEAGEAARAVREEREAELRSRFRQRTNDATAFTSTAPEALTE